MHDLSLLVFGRYSKVPNKQGGEGGVLISRGLEICVKYNKRGGGGWNIRGGRKMANRVPLRLEGQSRTFCIGK